MLESMHEFCGAMGTPSGRPIEKVNIAAATKEYLAEVRALKAKRIAELEKKSH